MNDITLRFLDIYEMLKKEKLIKSHQDFAKSIGVSSSAITEIFKKRTNIGIKIIQNTVMKYTQINIAWLFTGQGSMFIDTPFSKIQSLENNYISNSQISGKNTTTVKEPEIQYETNEESVLRRELEYLKKQLELKDQIIKSKEELIELLKSK